MRWSPKYKTNAGVMIANDGLTAVCMNGSWNAIVSTHSIKHGKWLIEFEVYMFNNSEKLKYWNIGNIFIERQRIH